MTISLPSEVLQCLTALENNNIEAYLVGGCVRDILLGKTPHDYDITTNADPSTVKKLFSHTIDTGIKHGTVTVIIDKMPIEITQMRIDGDYADHRRPTDVIPTRKIEEDLLRRDFTVNAIAMDLHGKIIDISGGKDDLQRHILRAVGDPKKRFDEDALRIMRAYRFSSQLGFKIEQNTEKAALSAAPSLNKISVERIFDELKKTLTAKNPTAISPLISCGALSFVGLKKCNDLSPLKDLPCNFICRMAALIIICGGDENRVCNLLKMCNEDKKRITSVCKCFKDNRLKDNPVSVKSLINQLGFDDVIFLCDLYSTLKKGLDFNEKNIKKMIKAAQNEPVFIKDLAVSGNDLKTLGIEGKNIGYALLSLQKAVWENPEKNKKSLLIDIAKKLF